MTTTKTVTSDKIQALYDCVQRRPRPEDVAELVLEVLGTDLKSGERKLLDTAARNSSKRSVWGYSSMAADFARPNSHVENQVKIASQLFGVESMTAAACMDPDRVEAFIKSVSGVVHKVWGANNFKGDRLNKAERQKLGLFKCQRWYNKRWRLLARMEKKLQNLVWNQRKYLFTRIGKSGLAVEIPFEQFSADVNTACFIAYLSARMSLRSTFTNTSQVRAYDKIAEMLFNRAVEKGTVRYDVVAYLMPDEKVLSKLSDEQKGMMIGRWWALLTDMADMLHECHRTSNFRRDSMIVKRGDDSSTWNQVAGGWNQARSHWLSIIHAMGLDSMLDTVCPGKVMRLMAADVAYWHQSSGGQIHPDTAVWAALPAPWEVVRGDKECTRSVVERVCDEHGVKREQWTGPRLDREAVEFTATPELVHGVSVTSPALAAMLRKGNAFSGKAIRGTVPGNVEIQRDSHGAALRTVESGV